MKTFLLAASASLLAATAPAFAQDSAPPAPAPTFSGTRVEFFAGYDNLRVRDRVDGTREHIRNDGITGGALLGYDLPIGDRFVVGPFASYAITATQDCAGGGCIKSGRQIEGGARIGARIGDRALVYGKGAYVNGQFTAHTPNADDTQYIVSRANRDGWRAGAGLEYALNAHAYVKAEYDYTRFKSVSADAFVGADDASRIRFDRQEALGGFGIRF